MRRCEMSYRRCESTVGEMMKMIDIEVRNIFDYQLFLKVNNYTRYLSLTLSMMSWLMVMLVSMILRGDWTLKPSLLVR